MRLQQMDQLAASNAAAPVRAQAVVAVLAADKAIEAGTGLGITEIQLRQHFDQSHPEAVNAIVALGTNPVTLSDLKDGFAQTSQAMIGRGEDVSLWNRMQLEFEELFVFRKRGAPSPAPSQILYRAEQRLNNGDLEGAASELQKLHKTPALTSWLDTAQRYIAAKAALDQLEKRALSLSPNMSAAQPISAAQGLPLQPDSGGMNAIKDATQ